MHSGSPHCGGRSPRIIRRNTGSRSILSEVVVTTGSSAAFLLAFLAAFEPGDRVGLAIPGYPAYRNILSALGIEPVLIAVGENAHYQPTPELLADLGSARRSDRREPGQSDRHDDQRRRSRPADRLLPRPRHPAGFGRDLPRDHLRSRRGDGARLWARGDHRQLVLEILQHDRVAARLDAGAAGPRPLGRMPGPEFLHFAAGAVANRSAPGVRLPRRARRSCRRVIAPTAIC